MLFGEIISFYCENGVYYVGRRQSFCGKVGGAYIYHIAG
jgi:hypothetical protein